jgi:DNA-binding response OmpR family regulator
MDERRILLVEDEARIADILRMGLVENGYEVEVAYDGNWDINYSSRSLSILPYSISICQVWMALLCVRRSAILILLFQ